MEVEDGHILGHPFLATAAQRPADGEQRVRLFSFGIALAFWQPGFTCSLDDPLVFLEEGWIVGKPESFLRQFLHRVPWS
jgi:hypothetical protein